MINSPSYTSYANHLSYKIRKAIHFLDASPQESPISCHDGYLIAYS